MKVNIKHVLVCVLVFCLSIKSTFAQEKKARVLIFLSPDETEIKLDDSLLHLVPKSFLYLNEGRHTVKLSAPYRIPVDTFINAKAGSMFVYRFGLRYKKDYVDYRRSLNAYKMHKFSVTVLPPIVIAAALITTYSFKQTSNDYYHKAENNIERYNNAVTNNQTDFDEYQKQFDQNYKKYKSFDKLSYVTIAAACGVTYYYIRLLTRQKLRKAPVYEEKISFGLFPPLNSYSANKQLSFQLKYKL